MTSSTVLDLSKRLQELESQAKMLRNDVTNLEATQRNLAISETTDGRVSELRRQAAEDEEADSVEASSAKRRRAPHTPARARQLPLPQDFIDELAHKASDVQVTIDKHRALTREKEDLMAILERVEGEADAAEQRYYDIADLAGVDADGHSTAAVGIRKKNDYIAARNELVALYREREGLAKVMQVQCDELASITAMVEDTANAEEQKAEAIAVLAEKRAKLAELRKEREQAERAVQSKDNILGKKSTGPSVEDIIRSANYDRRVALHALDKEDEQLKANDAAVRTRAMQIAKAEKRMEMIGDAVAGDGLSEEDRVDVELMEELITETKALYSLHTEAELRMSALDAKLEKIDYKICAVKRVIKDTGVHRERVEQEHARYLAKLQQDYNREQAANTEDIKRAEVEVEQLRSRSSKQTPRSRTSAARPTAKA